MPDQEIFGGIGLSLPRIVAAGGVVSTLHPVLSAEEQAALEHSADLLGNAAREVGYGS